MYGSSKKNCNTIEVTHGKERGQTPFVRSTLRAVPAKGVSPLFHYRRSLNCCSSFETVRTGGYPSIFFSASVAALRTISLGSVSSFLSWGTAGLPAPPNSPSAEAASARIISRSLARA